MKLFSVIIFCILSISLHANCIPELKRELRTYNKGLDLKRSFETKQELINKMINDYGEFPMELCFQAKDYLDMVWDSSYYLFQASNNVNNLISNYCNFDTGNNMRIAKEVVEVGSTESKEAYDHYAYILNEVELMCLNKMDFNLKKNPAAN